jgi:Leucine-rich repeat (LRR) protein
LLKPAVAANNVRVVTLTNVALNPKDLKDLPAMLNRFVGLQSLNLVNVGLRAIDGVKLPKLRACNLSDNAIADIKSVAALVSSCPVLETISLQGNPCAGKPRTRERLAAAAPQRLLRTIDARDVTPAELVAGTEEFGDKRQRADVELLRYDVALSALTSVRDMGTQWRPEALTDLDLRECDLAVFHVGSMRNLRALRLSRNRIANIVSVWFCALHRMRMC